MAEEETAAVASIDRELCERYGIKRPTYDQSDLADLKICMEEKLSESPNWKKDWMDESTLIRFLKAFITVEDAISALNDYFNWRVEKDVDTTALCDIDNDETMKVEKAKERDVTFDSFFDRCGRPIMLVNVRNHDKHHNNYPSLFRYVICILEQIMATADRRTPDNKICIIFDLRGFGLRNMDFKYVKNFLNMLRYYYPERIAQCFIVNYPWIFLGCWNIIKMWMNDVTRSKFLFPGKKELNDFMDLQNIPAKIFPNST